MNKVPFTNNGPHRRTVGGLACRPGETVYIDERDHPDYAAKAPAKEEAPPPSPVDAVLQAKAKDAKDLLAGLTIDQLDEVIEREARTTVKAAAEETKLEKAKAAGETKPEGSGDTKPEGSGDTKPEGSGDTKPEGEANGDTKPEGSGDTKPEPEGDEKAGA